MPLSEEDRDEIAHRLGIVTLLGAEVTVAAAGFAVGAERARKVKALEWVNSKHTPDSYTKCRQYVARRENGKWYGIFDGRGKGVRGTSNTLEAAQAACQAHHEQRVLGYLVEVAG